MKSWSAMTEAGRRKTEVYIFILLLIPVLFLCMSLGIDRTWLVLAAALVVVLSYFGFTKIEDRRPQLANVAGILALTITFALSARFGYLYSDISTLNAFSGENEYLSYFMIPSIISIPIYLRAKKGGFMRPRKMYKLLAIVLAVAIVIGIFAIIRDYQYRESIGHCVFICIDMTAAIAAFIGMGLAAIVAVLFVPYTIAQMVRWHPMIVLSLIAIEYSAIITLLFSII